MAISLSIENVLIQVRAKLQENGIKLWLSPYYSDEIGPNEAELESLAQNMCQILNIPYDYCLAAINELQTNAIDKLRARDDFAKTGTATLKVRVPNQVGGTKLLTINIKLNELGDSLYEKVASELSVPSSRIKLISSGSVINRLILLEDQSIQNNQQIMAIVLATTPTETITENAMYDKVKTIKDDAKLLVDKSDSYMDMEDQDGNLIHLPPEEKRALMLALAIHEKGRAALKREQFSEALIFFLEADQEYKTCNSKMLETVDNYALLNLDIVWCYLMLRSVTQLPDAEQRLKICEQNFKRSYGENLDRVLSLKGTAVNEKALIMRLHLLKAVLEFHRNQRNEAKRLFSLAEVELLQLKIDDTSLNTLIEMGYTPIEARIGLRACSNDINQALTYILDRRERRKKARDVGKAERRANRSLVKTTDETWVNPRNLHILGEMGFEKDLCAFALRKCENDINKALTLLQGNQDVLKQELAKEIVPDNELCEQMLNMGFDRSIVEMALRTVANNMDDAIEMLIKFQKEGKYDDTLQNLAETLAGNLNGGSDNGAGPSTSASTSTSNPKKFDFDKMKKEWKAADEAYERFAEDVGNEDDDHLDLPLVQEEKLLIEYKNLLDF